MLDNRKIIPPGTVMIESDGQQKLLLWEACEPRVLAVAGIQKGGPRTYFSIPDIFSSDATLLYTDMGPAHPLLKEITNRHHAINIKAAKHVDFPQAPIVIIVAPGQVTDEDLGMLNEADIQVVAVNNAINTAKRVDYYISRSQDERIADTVNGKDVSEIVGVFSTCCHPELSRKGWADTSWYTNLPYRTESLPWCTSTEGSITDALWFAINQLGARKVVMLGVEQPASVLHYFWEGIMLQAHCYFYSMHGVEIWNCTRATSVVGGVVLGNLKEALQ